MRSVVLAIGLCVASATAHADPARAQQLSAEAEALVAAGDLIGAAAKFRAAYKEEPRPEHMCNTGVAYHKAQDLPRAHRYLNACVAMGASLDPGYRDNLRRVVESIEHKLVAGNFTPIDIALEPPTAVLVIEGGKPYDEEIVGGGRIWVPYGAYRFVVRAPGYADNHAEVTANSDAAIPLRLTLAKAIEKPIVEKPIEKPIALRIDAPPPPSKVPAIVATSIGGAAAVAGLLFWMRARGYAEDAESPSNTVEQYTDLHDRAHASQRVAWILGGVAGAAAIASGVLWWRALRSPARVEVTATGTGIAIRGRF